MIIQQISCEIKKFSLMVAIKSRKLDFIFFDAGFVFKVPKTDCQVTVQIRGCPEFCVNGVFI